MEDVRIISGKQIIPSPEAVQELLGGQAGSVSGDKIKELYERLLPEIKMRVRAKAAFSVGRLDDGRKALFVLFTVGDGVTRLSGKYMASGDALAGIAADAMADSCLFSFEEQLLSVVEQFCREEGYGISRRLEPGQDIPIETQKTACDILEAERTLGLSLTSGYMLSPVKSMCLVFELSEHGDICDLGHDCSRCGNYGCGLRKTGDDIAAGREAVKRKLTVVIHKSQKADVQRREVTCAPGESLLETLRREGIFVEAPCSGMGSCGKCRVQVQKGELPVTDADRKFLTEEELQRGIRLACRAFPAEELTLAVTEQEESHFAAVGADVFAEEEPGTDEVCSGDAVLGAAIDIGTTTLAFSLVDVKKNRVIASHTAVNRQRSYGADVISRIRLSNEGKGERLRELILSDIRAGIHALLEKSGAGRGRLQRIAAAGNTTMLHLLMGYSCEGLGRYPFAPVTLAQETVTLPGISAETTLLPGISAFVGADITAGLYACGFHRGNENIMLIDLGTNGELALRTPQGILVTSAAAGPAFEGGNISCGMGSLPGAVSQVRIRRGLPEVRTIGGGPPAGICGTGVIDAAAELLRAGLLDENGRLAEPYFESGYPLAVTEQGRQILLTQQDIRELQMAKGAIRAGIEILLSQSLCGYEDIDRVCLSGGFGDFLDAERAAEIGLLPEELAGKTKASGNTSLKGAIRFLMEPEEEKSFSELARRAEEIPLAQLPRFQELYIKYMSFKN